MKYYKLFSFLWNVQSMKCPICEMSNLWNVLSMKCPICEMSHLWNVLFMNCPIYEMSYLWNFQSMKCPIYKISYLWNVQSVKCPIYEMSCLWNVPSVKCPIYEMSHKMSDLLNVLYMKSLICKMSYLWFCFLWNVSLPCPLSIVKGQTSFVSVDGLIQEFLDLNKTSFLKIVYVIKMITS